MGAVVAVAAPSSPALADAPKATPRRPTADDLVRQARDAFAAKDYERSEMLVRQAVVAGPSGSTRLAAQILYGDSLAARGEVKRAKWVFVALRDRTTGATRAELVRRIERCDKLLATTSRSR